MRTVSPKICCCTELALAHSPFASRDDPTCPPFPVFSRRYSAVTMAPYTPMAEGWSPMPLNERAGIASGPARTRSIRPDRAHQAVTSKPGFSASGPVSP